VSLDPPLVLWSLRECSDTIAAFSAATHYTVNVLTQGQRQLSRKFGNRLQHELTPDEYFEGVAGSPVLNGALASFECEIVARHNAGDHIIYIGRVIDLRQANSGKPLLFYGGTYLELVDAK
jgi:flavin reductase (DIM6/NTAB) family NADH-FMN oxidoreductase RutF